MLRKWIWRRQWQADDRELATELQWHLQQLVREKVGAGISVETAEREARLQFGHVESLKEQCRDSRRGAAVRALRQDLRTGFRMLLKQPLLSCAAACTTLLTVGVACTAFTLIDATWLRPSLAEIDVGGLFIVLERSADGRPIFFSYADFFRFRQAAADEFEVAAERQASVTLKAGAKAEVIAAWIVSENFLRVLGTSIGYGRDFPAENNASEEVCVLRYDFAGKRFKTPANAIGQELVIDGVPRKVIGVLPKGFQFVGDTEVLLPLRSHAPQVNQSGDDDGLYCVVRAKKHKSFNVARPEIDAQLRRLAHETSSPISGALVRPLRDTLSHYIRPQLWTLGGGALLVLLAGYATAVSLSYAKVSSRWRELTLRCALGATRARLVSQLFCEELLVTLPAALAGLLVAALMLQWAKAIPFGAIHPAASIGLSGAAIAGGLLVSVLLAYGAVLAVAGVFQGGTLPATIASTSYRVTLTRAGKRKWHGLIVAQGALTVVTFAAACLLLRDLTRLRRSEMGFNSQDLFLLQLPAAGKLVSSPSDTVINLEQSVTAISGISSATFSAGVPIFFLDPVKFTVTATTENADRTGFAMFYATTPGFLDTFGLRLIEGRFLDSSDTSSSKPVAVVDEEFVRQQFADADPLGRQITVTARGESAVVEIVGVVGHISQFGPALVQDNEVQIYRPFVQLSARVGRDLIRAGAHVAWRVTQGADQEALAKMVAAKVHELAPEEPGAEAESMQDRITLALNPRRTWLILFGFAALAALFLAGAGTYAVTSYAVTGHTHETCIRVALGCSRRHLVGAICTPIMKRVLLGVVLGGAIAFPVNTMLSRAMSLERDLAFTSGAAAIICTLCVALIACAIPTCAALRAEVAPTLNAS